MEELVYWKPYGENHNLHTEMDGLPNRFMHKTCFYSNNREEWLSSVDIWEIDKRIILKSEVPDFEAKDITIIIYGNILIIKGRKKRVDEQKGEYPYLTEPNFIKFRRLFWLPKIVQAERGEVTLSKGILKMTFPIAKETEKKVIEIKVT